MKLLALVLLLPLCSCSYVHEFGQVGSKRFVKIQAGSLTAPAQTMIVIVDTNSNEVTMLTPMGGNGILTAATLSGSIVGGSYFIGKGLGKGGDKTTVNASAESSAQSEAAANSLTSPVIKIPDPPTAPPIGVGPPFGSKQNWPRNFHK